MWHYLLGPVSALPLSFLVNPFVAHLRLSLVDPVNQGTVRFGPFFAGPHTVNCPHLCGTSVQSVFAAAAAKSLQSCPTLCDPRDGSPPGCPVPGILQARTLEWVVISFSSAWKWKVKVKSLSRVRLLATPWAAAYQASPSMGFSRQEYWSGVPLPSKRMLHHLK